MVLTRNESELNAFLWLFQLPRRCKARVPSPRRNLDIFDALFLAHLLPQGSENFRVFPSTNAPSDEEAGGVGLSLHLAGINRTATKFLYRKVLFS